MTSSRDDPNGALTEELAALRAALRDVHAPAEGEVALRAALRARRQAATVRPLPAARRRARVPAFAAAAALAAGAVLVLMMLRAGPDDSAAPLGAVPISRVAAAGVAGGSTAGAAFHPLAFAPGFSASQSYSVVRVRIPLAALAPGNMAPPDATIEADLLVGEDGLARGIRFDSADTLLVAARED